MLELPLERSEKEFTLRQELRTAREQLLNSMGEWRLRYCLIAPIGGVVTFTDYWSENQYIPSGEVAFTIVPQGENRLMGKVRIPMARSGKVRRGQRVIVRFSNFPDQEFGVVNGTVANISLVPSDEFYTADIDFPEGLRTNYGIDLPVSPETRATAEIVTGEPRLIDRLFLPFKRAVKEGLQTGRRRHTGDRAPVNMNIGINLNIETKKSSMAYSLIVFFRMFVGHTNTNGV